MSNAMCSTLLHVVLAIAMSFLSGCATVGSNCIGNWACLPIVEYSWEFQARVANELALLPEGSAVEEMLSDYAVIREQARSCRSTGTLSLLR